MVDDWRAKLAEIHKGTFVPREGQFSPANIKSRSQERTEWTYRVVESKDLAFQFLLHVYPDIFGTLFDKTIMLGITSEVFLEIIGFGKGKSTELPTIDAPDYADRVRKLFPNDESGTQTYTMLTSLRGMADKVKDFKAMLEDSTIAPSGINDAKRTLARDLLEFYRSNVPPDRQSLDGMKTWAILGNFEGLCRRGPPST